jgi:hypothetical protein
MFGTKWPPITSTWIRAAPLDLGDLLAQSGEISREN